MCTIWSVPWIMYRYRCPVRPPGRGYSPGGTSCTNKRIPWDPPGIIIILVYLHLGFCTGTGVLLGLLVVGTVQVVSALSHLAAPTVHTVRDNL